MPDRPLIQTPEYLKDYAAKIHAELIRQSAFVSKLPRARRSEWGALRRRWIAWYSAGPSWIWGATNDTLDGYADATTAWAAELARVGAPSPVASTSAPEPYSPLSGGLVWAVLGLGALYLIGKGWK